MIECVSFKTLPEEYNRKNNLNVYRGDASKFTINHEFNEYPGIIQFDDVNPTVYSPNSMDFIQFYATKETMLDVDFYRNFISNCVSRFRSSRDYKNIKSRLMGMGLNHCQVLGYIEDEKMAKIEMHHNIIGIRDIAIMITEHTLNTVGAISSFDLICMLIEEHKLDNVPIVMLSETMHEKYEDDPNSFLPPNMTYGKWWELLYKYRYGITLDIAYKVINYITKAVNSDDPYKDFWIQLRKDVKDWSGNNIYGMDPGADNSIGMCVGSISDARLFAVA